MASGIDFCLQLAISLIRIADITL